VPDQLGRRRVGAQLAQRRHLVQLPPHAVDNEFAFYIAWRGDSPKLRRIHALRDWLRAEAGAGRA